MTKPSDFVILYNAWYADRIAACKGDAKAIKAFKDEPELTIDLNTSAMNVLKNDSLIDLSVILDNKKIVNLNFSSKFAKNETALLIQDKTGAAAIYDITLPATEDAFNLKVDLPVAATTMQAPKGATTKLDMLMTWASWAQKFGNDIGGHNEFVKGLTLGEGLVVEAINPQDGDVIVDGAEIDAIALLNTDSTYVHCDFPEGGYKVGTGTIKNNSSSFSVTDGANKAITFNAVKVYPTGKNDTPSNVSFNYSNYAKVAMEKMIVASGAEVNVKSGNVAVIEGAAKDKSKVNIGAALFMTESVSKVTITNNYLDLNSIVSADALDDCIIEATEVLVYAEAGLTNVTFKAPLKKDVEQPQNISVIPLTQSSVTPDYTYTFTNCNFQKNTKLVVSDNGGYFNGQTPIIGEDGEYLFKWIWHYAYLDENGDWQWASTDNEAEISQEALKLGYWEKVKEYLYASTNGSRVSPDLIDDYDVIIALDKCKVNGKDVDDQSGIYDIYTPNRKGEYDINDMFAIDGVLYTPVRVYLSESDQGNGIAPSYVYLRKVVK